MPAQSPWPDRLGPYRLLEKIGEGGMGVVYRALDPDGRAVAVKLLRPGVAGDPDARRRLSREFETMRRVRSPFVAGVIDADVTGDMPYVVTRYVAGPSVDQKVRQEGPLHGPALERLAWGLAEGLAAVHAAGVVHRDLKPGNVVLAGGVPVLIDFGIAHAPDVTRITQAGMFMGTPGYLAPEVVEGQPSGPPADVHSWASTVAFAATGRPPFGTGSYETIFYRIISGRPDLDGLPAKLIPLVTAALARDPGRRPSAVQLSTDCAAIDLSGPDVPPGDRAGTGRRPAGGAGPAVAAPAAVRAPSAVAYRAPSAVARVPSAVGYRVPSAVGSRAPAAGGTMIDGPAALAGPPAGAVGSGLRPRTRPMPAAPEGRDQAGPLPPARYPAAAAGPAAGAAAAGAVPAARAPAGRQASTEAQVRYRGLLALLAMAVAAAASVLLPVAGPAVALVMIVLLRAADRAHGRLSRRRSLRGARASDVPVLLATAPWALVRALASSVLLAPLALACGAAAAAVTILAAHGLPYRAAAGYGAGAFIAFYGFGLGSAKPRRQLGRLFGPVARRRLSAALTAVLLLVLAVAVAAAAVTQPHQIWPLSPRLTWQMPGLRHLTAQLAHGLHHL